MNLKKFPFDHKNYNIYQYERLSHRLKKRKWVKTRASGKVTYQDGEPDMERLKVGSFIVVAEPKVSQ